VGLLLLLLENRPLFGEIGARNRTSPEVGCTTVCNLINLTYDHSCSAFVLIAATGDLDMLLIIL
jgi:hypothetical protein